MSESAIPRLAISIVGVRTMKVNDTRPRTARTNGSSGFAPGNPVQPIHLGQLLRLRYNMKQ
jgi:hypothetical protein